jgi:CHAD domain-containing protein
MTLSHPLKRPYDRQLRAFNKHLELAVQGEIEPLHQCRVATRRLREILPLCAMDVPRASTKRVGSQLRRVGRALGGVREIDVALEVVGELEQKQISAVTCAARLRHHLLDERDSRRGRMLERLSAIRSKRLERNLTEIRRTLGARPQSAAWAKALAQRIARRARRVRETAAAAGALYVPERVHAVRIAAKKLRYALEFAHDTGEAQTRPPTRQLKAVQDTLGRLHDLEVLRSVVQDLVCFDAHDGSWSRDLDALAQELERECRELHSRYVGTRAHVLDVCDTAMTIALQIWTDRGGAAAAWRALKMSLPGADGKRTQGQRRVM